MHNTIKHFSQSEFIGPGSMSKNGICYYLCNYVDEKVWNGLLNYDDGVQKAREFIPLPAVNYAKAQNLLYGQQDGYVVPFRNFLENKLYRMSFTIEDESFDVRYDEDGKPYPTHEVILITGPDKTLLFDPNEGFLEFNDLDVMNVIADRKEYYKQFKEVSSFKIKMIRSITSKEPLGFKRIPIK